MEALSVWYAQRGVSSATEHLTDLLRENTANNETFLPAMLQILKTTLLVLTALFPIVNPLGGAPIFLSHTYYYLAEDRKLLSRRIAINGFLLLIVS